MVETQKTLPERLDRINQCADPLERFIGEFGKTLSAPLFYHSGKQHYGFRFAVPCERHFCLLKGVRLISAFRASIVLARQGYVQEVFVLLRTLTEFSTHIEYVLLARNEDGSPTPELAAYLQAFFSDFARNDERDFGRVKLRQGDIHKAVGASFDAKAYTDRDIAIDPTRKLLSRVYRELSNYVHGRYPEIMDMYGGNPALWHTSGMPGTPKDAETTEFLEASLVTISQVFRLMVRGLNLAELISTDAALLSWYNSVE